MYSHSCLSLTIDGIISTKIISVQANTELMRYSLTPYATSSRTKSLRINSSKQLSSATMNQKSRSCRFKQVIELNQDLYMNTLRRKLAKISKITSLPI